MIVLCLLLDINQPFHQNGPRRPHSQAPWSKIRTDQSMRFLEEVLTNTHKEKEPLPPLTHSPSLGQTPLLRVLLGSSRGSM